MTIRTPILFPASSRVCASKLLRRGQCSRRCPSCGVTLVWLLLLVLCTGCGPEDEIGDGSILRDAFTDYRLVVVEQGSFRRVDAVENALGGGDRQGMRLAALSSSVSSTIASLGREEGVPHLSASFAESWCLSSDGRRVDALVRVPDGEGGTRAMSVLTVRRTGDEWVARTLAVPLGATPPLAAPGTSRTELLIGMYDPELDRVHLHAILPNGSSRRCDSVPESPAELYSGPSGRFCAVGGHSVDGVGLLAILNVEESATEMRIALAGAEGSYPIGWTATGRILVASAREVGAHTGEVRALAQSEGAWRAVQTHQLTLRENELILAVHPSGEAVTTVTWHHVEPQFFLVALETGERAELVTLRGRRPEGLWWVARSRGAR